MERKGRDYTSLGASGKLYFLSAKCSGQNARKTPIPLGLADVSILEPINVLAGFIARFLLH
jgi:hypothetical protein